MNLRSRTKLIASRLLARVGYSRIRKEDNISRFPDLEDIDISCLERVTPYTMTTLERRYHLLQSVRYITKYKIPGAIVECGVWRGGSMMLVANALTSLEDISRELYLYDTYEGMPPPTDVDRDCGDCTASIRLEEDHDKKAESVVWAMAGLEEVKENMHSTKYPMDRIRFISGKVEETIPNAIPSQIAILRLDTDWYESTAHELKYLYPLVSSGGVVIIDDYGYWKGARKAVDEFLEATPDIILLHRIDDTGRAFVKP